MVSSQNTIFSTKSSNTFNPNISSTANDIENAMNGHQSEQEEILTNVLIALSGVFICCCIVGWIICFNYCDDKSTAHIDDKSIENTNHASKIQKFILNMLKNYISAQPFSAAEIHENNSLIIVPSTGIAMERYESESKKEEKEEMVHYKADYDTDDEHDGNTQINGEEGEGCLI